MSQSAAALHWVFTLNNPDGPLDTTWDKIKYVSWQLEKGENGTPHFQGYVQCTVKQRLTALKKWLPSAHFEISRGTPEQARDYTRKEDSREDGPWEFGEFTKGQGRRSDLEAAITTLKESGVKRVAQDHPAVFVKFHKGIEALANALEEMPRDPDFVPRPWQAKVLAALTQQPADDRTIHWVFDQRGNQGKSRLANHLIMEHNAVELSGRVQDMAYIYNRQPIVIFDISRTQSDNMQHLYSFAESLKNGKIISTKYESRMKMFKTPHVVFFSNSMPDEGCWTVDRCKLWDLNCPNLHV